MASALDNIDLNQMSHRYVSGVLQATVSDKNSWDTLTKRCFFPSRAPPGICTFRNHLFWKTLEIPRIEREKAINRGKKSLFL